MVESTTFALTDKATTEKWLSDNGIPFNVSQSARARTNLLYLLTRL